MCAQSCCVTACPGRDMTALYLLQHQDVALPCMLLITSSLLEIHVSSWERICASNWQVWRWTVVIYWILTVRLRHAQIHGLRNNTQPLPLKHFRAVSRQTCRQEHTSWMLQTLHSLVPLSNTRISSRSKRNFQSSQKSGSRVAEWLNRAQGPEELLCSRTIMLVQ